MQLERLLAKVGFSKNETKVYLISLGMGKTSAQKIAKQADIPRTTAYSTLNCLIRRGVVSKTMERGKTRFVAETPEKLLLILEDLHMHVKNSLPELKALYGTSDTKPKIAFYEGEGAVKRVYDDTLIVLKSKPENILMFCPDSYFDFENSGRLDSNYINTRVRYGIGAKRIVGEGSRWHTIKKPIDRLELSETVVVPREMFWPDIELNIYANKIGIMNFAEKTSLFIESKPITDAMRQIYHLAWLGAKTVEVKN